MAPGHVRVGCYTRQWTMTSNTQTLQSTWAALKLLGCTLVGSVVGALLITALTS